MRFLMVVRGDGEAEPATVDTDAEGSIILELDDGERLSFNEQELRAALEQQRAA